MIVSFEAPHGHLFRAVVLRFQPGTTFDTFAGLFESAVEGIGLSEKAVMIVDTQHVKLSLLAQVLKFEPVYARSFKKLQATFKHSIVIVTSDIVRPVLRQVLRWRKDHATQIHIVASAQEATETLARIEKEDP
jgi:hypothetical protein